MGTLLTIVIIIAVLYFIFKGSGNSNERTIEQIRNVETQTDVIRSKYDSQLWDFLSSHHEGPGAITNYAMGDLQKIIKNYPSSSLDYQYQLLITSFIKNGNSSDPEDYLQAFSPSQIKKLIAYCNGDFVLFLFCTLYLSAQQYRDLIDEDIQNLHLFLDLIYSKALGFREKKILFLQPSERYQLATVFLVSWHEW